MPKKTNKARPRKASKSSSAPARRSVAKRPRTPPGNGYEQRIARALETIATNLSAASGKPGTADSLHQADAFVWHPEGRLVPVPRVSRVDLSLLKGIDRMRDILIENT